MLLQAVTLDASMPVALVLARLARHGLWLSVDEPHAREWIDKRAALWSVPGETARARLQRDPANYGVAIRRQLDSSVLWYAIEAREVLWKCKDAHPGAPLIDVLNLHETDSVPAVEPAAMSGSSSICVVLQSGQPLACNFQLPTAGARPSTRSVPSADVRRGGERSTRPRGVGDAFGVTETESATVVRRPVEVRAWPRIEAPEFVRAGESFDVVVGLGAQQQAGVAGGAVTIPVPDGDKSIDVTVELTSDGFDAPGGWTRTLTVPVDAPTSVSVTFTLVGRPPDGSQPLKLTTLEVRYIVKSTVCGWATKPVVIAPAGAALRPSQPGDRGTPWLSQPDSGTPVVLAADSQDADLTIELAKPDRDPAQGRFVCRLRSPHALTVPTGPFDVDLGAEAKTFAATIIEGVRQHGGGMLGANLLESLGDLVTEVLPLEVFDALHEVARLVKPRTPAVLIVSAEPFVPWELATVKPPLDDKRPIFLGAQADVGRWLRDVTPTRGTPKPPPHPPSQIAVDHMAVMAGKYKSASGLSDLPAAEAEAAKLVSEYNGIPLPASQAALKQLLDAQLTRGFDTVAPGAVHFAGHGQFSATDPDSSVLFLNDGSPISSLLFRSAKYGGDRQPFIFLNACMIGVGGELLGDMGGFPGNCLRGGFGALLGALWAVDDADASDVARIFWSRALPASGTATETVGEILRELRQSFGPAADGTTTHTYLAYTYYGHPRLRMQRV